MNIRYFFVGDVCKRGHIIIKHCPTDEMIGDFFTKPLGGAKFRRFRNIIMNISHDEHGAVNIDELTAIHQAKMKKRIEMEPAAEDKKEEVERTVNKVSKVSPIVGSQECVGDLRSARSNGAWAIVRSAHKNRGGGNTRPTYAQIVAE